MSGYADTGYAGSGYAGRAGAGSGYAGTGGAGSEVAGGSGADGGIGAAAPGLWVEEPALRRRMPDPVRTAAVRAVLIVSVTLIQATVTFFLTLTGSWLALPMALGAIAGTIVATWGVLDVWITRQAWNQRYGVLSQPSSTARGRRREAHRAARAAHGRGPRIPRAEGPLAAPGRH
ncbi:hypothetical protein ACFWUQ_21225 [Streptomyces sp. NPDC058662]|uniref:hypothetical protein n=1 Tax=Streptomyces sp. NPDC058662 TaxID=3346583 RepID=UPI00364A66A5